MIKLKMLLKQTIMPGTKFKVLKKFQGSINSNTRYSQGIVKTIPVGSFIEYEGCTPNGNSWFNYNEERFKIDGMSVQELIKHDIIKRI